MLPAFKATDDRRDDKANALLDQTIVQANAHVRGCRVQSADTSAWTWMNMETLFGAARAPSLFCNSSKACPWSTRRFLQEAK